MTRDAGEPARIFLVDDGDAMYPLVRTALPHEGFATEGAGTGREAPRLAESFSDRISCWST